MEALLPAAYFAPVQYFTKLLMYDSIHIEQWEHFPKQTYRNRCNILTSNGIQTLTVPVERGSIHKVLMRDLKIAYHTPWQKVHRRSIEAAYRNSPFFEYYYDEIVPFFEQRFSFLIDFNMQITLKMNELLGIKNHLILTKEYQKNPCMDDLRYAIHPKTKYNTIDKYFSARPYCQVFVHESGFVANLSMLDMLFCCGPDSKELLSACINKQV